MAAGRGWPASGYCRASAVGPAAAWLSVFFQTETFIQGANLAFFLVGIVTWRFGNGFFCGLGFLCCACFAAGCFGFAGDWRFLFLGLLKSFGVDQAVQQALAGAEIGRAHV